MSQKFIRCFLDADMRCQHTGLAAMAQKTGVNVWRLKQGQHVIFINNACNRVKMFSSNGVLSYLKSPKRIDLETIQHIPQAFSDTGSVEAAYQAGLKKKILLRLGQRTVAKKVVKKKGTQKFQRRSKVSRSGSVTPLTA